MNALKNKVALVTGASRGLGRGIALALAEEGAAVAVNYLRSSAEADAVVSQITQSGGNAIKAQADISRPGDVDRLFGLIQERFGRLDILVNNAGTNQPKDIFSETLEDWHHVLETNLTSCFLCSKKAMEIMAAQKEGRIVNISSIVGEQGALFGYVHYAASKSAMLGFTKTLARTGAPLGITVNAVAPGIIETELLHQILGEEKIQQVRSQVPLGLGSVRDVGLAVVYLCGEGGNYITGATIDVNGGLYFR